MTQVDLVEWVEFFKLRNKRREKWQAEANAKAKRSGGRR